MKPYRHPSLAKVSFPDVVKALSDPCRMKILRTLLDEGEVSCCEVPLRVSKATRSHHFSVLREAGLIRTRVEGTRCLTSARKEEIDERFPGLLDLILQDKPAPVKRPAKKTTSTRPAKAVAAR